MPRPRCSFQDCPLKARYGFSTTDPIYCVNHKLKNHRRTKTSICQFQGNFCKKDPIYGVRGGSAQYCHEHRDLRIDVHQKNTFCQYPKCQMIKGTSKRAKFCSQHVSKRLPFDYVDLVAQIRGRDPDQPEPFRLPPFRELIRGISEYQSFRGDMRTEFRVNPIITQSFRFLDGRINYTKRS